jgi:hypothetical protein
MILLAANIRKLMPEEEKVLCLRPYMEMPKQVFFFFFFLMGLGLNSGFHAYKVGALLLEPSLQSILLWLFWRWDVSQTI